MRCKISHLNLKTHSQVIFDLQIVGILTPAKINDALHFITELPLSNLDLHRKSKYYVTIHFLELELILLNLDS